MYDNWCVYDYSSQCINKGQVTCYVHLFVMQFLNDFINSSKHMRKLEINCIIKSLPGNADANAEANAVHCICKPCVLSF